MHCLPDNHKQVEMKQAPPSLMHIKCYAIGKEPNIKVKGGTIWHYTEVLTCIQAIII